MPSNAEVAAYIAANRRGSSTQLLNYLTRKYFNNFSVAQKIAGNPRTSFECLEQLSRHPIATVRTQVAINRRAGEEVWERLATDSEWLVRWALTQNSHVPKYILQMLMDDNEPRVVHSAKAQLRKR